MTTLPPSGQSHQSSQEGGYTLSRVETNQRALIDKILARYATQNAVYRELLQNSNDAGAQNAEIRFTTTAGAIAPTNANANSSAAEAAAGISVRPSSSTGSGSSSSVVAEKSSKRPLVTKVLYRNDGMPFREQDWARLSKIAEGNPDPNKVGAFGVGAYTMFSVCEEPMVISGDQALMFVWRGDALWTRVGPIPTEMQMQLDSLKEDQLGKNDTSTFTSTPKNKEWTTFVLDSRDLYPVPHMKALGQFLASSLTFTKSLHTVRVYVDEQLVMTLVKRTSSPKEIAVAGQQQTKAWSAMSGWMRGEGSSTGTVVTSSNGIFTLGSPPPSSSSSRTLERLSGGGAGSRAGSNEAKSILESLTRLTVTVGQESSSVDARYITAPVTTRITRDMAKRMERVTKKAVPPELRVEVFLQAGASEVDGRCGGSGNGATGKRSGATTNADADTAAFITASFAPTSDGGKIYIGFATSQTTGLAAHVAAPFVPTVEREAIDLVDPTLRMYNSELLQISGMVLRLGLERALQGISERFEAMHDVYLAEDEALIKEARAKRNSAEEEKKVEDEDIEDISESKSEDTTVSKSLFSFAKYMAKGVKSTIVTAVKTIDEIVSNDEEEELTRPLDPRPLSFEEREAILLMRSFCAKPSTPDADIGIAIADGFMRVLPDISPPVLTRTGVVRGNFARLPKDGLEAYVNENVVRRVVLENAREYHEYVAQCRTLTMRDFVAVLEAKGIHFDEAELHRFMKWWIKYNHIHPCSQYGIKVKRHVSFTLDNDPEPKSLDKIYYFRDRSIFTDDKLLPMPDSVIAPSFQAKIGTRMLEDVALQNWFSPLAVDVWASFVSQQSAMTNGLASDADSRNLILSVLSREFRKQTRIGRREGAQFQALIHNLLSEKRCLPFEDAKGVAANDPKAVVTDLPTELYLSSANLEAFSGISSFRKVSPALKDAGISDDFLLALGVRKSVSVDFLFNNLENLKWSDDPKALVDYLRTATLTPQDLQNLRSMAYLPSLNDTTRTFAPSELFLGTSELSDLNLPFIRLLKWTPDEKLSVDSADGKFLVRLGCQVDPPLQSILKYLSSQVDISEATRLKCLKFVCKRLQPGGAYEQAWAKSSSSALRKLNFLPSTRKDPFGDGTLVNERRSPECMYSDAACQVMGFVVLDAEFDRKSGRILSASFRLASKPPPQMLLKRLLEIVATAKMLLEHAGDDEESRRLRGTIISLFDEVFSYLSSRLNDFNASLMRPLQKESFIPCKDKALGRIGWYRPLEIYFSDSEKSEDEIISLLFHSVQFSPFLASAGVKSEASIQDILHSLVTKPREVLSKIGVERYTNLLHRIASEPIRNLSRELLQSQFLIAFKQEEDKEGEGEADVVATPVLARAQDIFLIDNYFFGRMFPSVLKAPHETDLESLYHRFGSRYISESVKKTYRVLGQQFKSTPLTVEFARRLQERKGLLCSPKNSSRPLVSDAAKLLDQRSLEVIQVDAVEAIYSFGVQDKVQKVTCCSNRKSRAAVSFYITEDLDFFDVGACLGDLILQRCELEDAFLLSNLLEAPLDTLRARGFAVDRAVKVKEYKSEMKKKPPPVSSSATTPVVSAESNPGTKSGSKTASADAPSGTESFDSSDDNSIVEEISKLAKLAESAADASAAAAVGAPLTNTSAAAAAAARGKPPSSKPRSEDEEDILRNKKRRGLRKLLGGRGGSSKMPSSSSQQPSTTTASTAEAGISHHHVPPSQTGGDNDAPVSPEADAVSHERLKGMLTSSLASCKGTATSGINSAERLATALPDGLGRENDGCEVIPSQQLKIFGRTTNGIKVFSSLKHGEESEAFLRNNVVIIKTFASVLELISEVYGLNLNSIAIYYEQSGNTIAFNSNKALYFNLRLFAHLHYRSDSPLTYDCYSYWFVTCGHELAHNLVSAHNKDHGYYTESYITMFLPSLSAKLIRMGIQ